MPPAELDLPIFASAEQIRRREFVTTRRGYDPDQVRDYLGQIASQVEQMEALVRQARQEAEAAPQAAAEPQPDPYETFSLRMAGLIKSVDEDVERFRREAQEEATRIVAEARVDADRVIVEARAEADRVRLDAQSQAEESKAEGERALREVRERADRTLAALSLRRDALVEQLAEMQNRLRSVARDLEAAIEQPSVEALDAIGTMPMVPEEEERAERPEVPEVPQTADAAEDRPDAGPRIEGLWSSPDADDISMPDIGPLDLRWEDEDEDEGTRD